MPQYFSPNRMTHERLSEIEQSRFGCMMMKTRAKIPRIRDIRKS